MNIPGYAYFGREPYSTVDRIERRFQFADNGTITRGRHTFKVGADFTLLQLRSAKQQIFELDFGGVVDFGGLPTSTFGLAQQRYAAFRHAASAFRARPLFQAYGLGIPTDLHPGHRHFQRAL